MELPEGYPLLPEAYREFLRYKNDKQARVNLIDCAALVARSQPVWLSKILAKAVPTATYTDKVQNELTEMLEQLGVSKKRPRSQPEVSQAQAQPRAPSAPQVERLPVEWPPLDRPLVVEFMRSCCAIPPNWRTASSCTAQPAIARKPTSSTST